MPKTPETQLESERQRLGLHADCSNCLGLCCVALPFAASSDFAVDKQAGAPCTNLADDNRCRIHDRLRSSGFAGCTTFDCIGAGQKTSQVTFHGRDWRTSTVLAGEMFAAFPVMRQLHELLWYLTEAAHRTEVAALHDDVAHATAEIEDLTRLPAPSLLGVDVGEARRRVDVLLTRASQLVRSAAPGPGPRPGAEHRHADLVGAKLVRADLGAAHLRGALMMGADLRHANMRYADLLGADLRGADLRGADLTGGLFLTQAQLNAARGDATTSLPGSLDRPTHWD